MKPSSTSKIVSVAALAVTLAAAGTARAQLSDFVFLSGAPVLALAETNSELIPAFAQSPITANVGIQIYEDATSGVVSDQLWAQAGFWYFASDTNLVNFTQLGIQDVSPVGAPIVETGAPQDVSVYFGLPAGFIAVQSDVEVPEPASLGLFAAGGGLLLLLRRQRRNAS
jgi:hypothetical protein